MATERLTALDASFLYLERPAMHMHVAGLSVLDPSTRPDGRLRFEDVERVFASRLHLAPRLRQKVKMVPFGLALPVWVDDAAFDLDFHIRRAALPHPGGRIELGLGTGLTIERGGTRISSVRQSSSSTISPAGPGTTPIRIPSGP